MPDEDRKTAESVEARPYTVEPHNRGELPAAFWPITDTDDFCGEHAPREEAGG